MRFGIREVCDMTFEKLSGIGPKLFNITSAKTSTLEGASTTVYAQGGKGNSRLIAWEGEKTLTFTVEDALITMESFYALTGASVEDTVNGIKFTSKTTSFAGYYSISADTLFRDENGNDHAAYIKIPRAKLQSNISISMAPSGDPSSFTFTFDALPGIVDPHKDVLFTLEIYDKDDVIMENPETDITSLTINGETYAIKNAQSNCSFTVNAVDGTITFSGTEVIDAETSKTKAHSYTFRNTVVNTADSDLVITDLTNLYSKTGSNSITKGTSVTLYII